MMDYMNTLVLKEPHHFVFENKPIPSREPGSVLIKVNTVAICGSDIHAFSGVQPMFSYPRILGHEICGTVAEADCAGFSPGDKVCVMPYLYCGECVSCKQGRTNCCTTLRVLGVHTDGGLCEYISMPAQNVLRVPDDMDGRIVSLIEPLSVSAHGVKRGRVGKDDRVLVVGAGPIGLGAAEIARCRGAQVVLADTSEVRANFVKENFGYTVLNPLDGSYLDELNRIFIGLPNKVFDSTGNARSMANAVNCMEYGGTIVFLGVQRETINIDNTEFHKREATILASRVAQEEDFRTVLELILSGALHPEKLITHITALERAKDDLEAWIKLGPGVFKGLVTIN